MSGKTLLTDEQNAQEREAKGHPIPEPCSPRVSPFHLPYSVGHRFIDPLTPSRTTHSDASYPKKYRLPA